ncbi:unnamed protein product [Symbiodinium sp. CCMP2456]|nr:unnamed protein product [Symbiodinium sp. CCMP2456]
MAAASWRSSMRSVCSHPTGFSNSVSVLPNPSSSSKPKRGQSSKGRADGSSGPLGPEPQNEFELPRGSLESQRWRSRKIAAKLQALLGNFQNPALVSKMPWVRSQHKQSEHKIPSFVMSKDDLTQLLKAEEADRFHIAERRARQLRAAVTIDDQAADELDMERRGVDAVQITSDLNPAFADGLVRFGVLRHEVKEKAEERRAKANRLLSRVAAEVRHGQSKRRLKRGRSRGFEENFEEVEVPKAPAQVEDERDVMRRHRLELEKPIAKFDKWVDGHLRRQGLVRPKTAPARSRASCSSSFA